MIKKLILINSANFNFLDVNLEKDLFFLGDNGSGKTTVIRAIHYLFSGDVRNLGIPTDKDGFKEYYFRYPNSYMIYIFEDFFIFMYKVGGEIVKLFSKQQFDMQKIIDENSNLYELDMIKRYVKSANMKKTVKSLSEYRDIIYGNDKRLLDFRLTTIKNSTVFIGLFNEIFNIDKSIIDSKSIKKAIQTTLDYETKVMEFDHEKYLQDIYTFQSQYKFFQEFQKQKETIESAKELKDRLESFEDNLDELLSFIAYSFKKESLLLQESKSKHQVVDAKLQNLKSLKIKRVKTLKECDEKYTNFSNIQSLEIQRVKNLKEKFSQENILKNRDIAAKYETIKEKMSQTQEQYIELKKGFASELESIESQIEDLEHTKNRRLQREFEDKKDNKKRFLKSQLDEAIEKAELAFETQVSISKSDIKDIKDEIKNFKSDIKREQEVIAAFEKEHKERLVSIEEKYTHLTLKKTQSIKEKSVLRDVKEREIVKLTFKQEDLLREKENLLTLNQQNYENDKQRVKTQIGHYARMIYSKPNSFKEFLNEEVDGWESELYPLLDETLLDMSCEELEPKLFNEERIFNIKLNTQTLKQMLSRDEAVRKKEAYEVELGNLEESYTKAIQQIQDQHLQEIQKMNEERLYLEKEVEVFNEEIRELRQALLNLKAEESTEIDDKREEFRKKIATHNKTIATYTQEVENSLYTIEEIEKQIQKDKRELLGQIKDLEYENSEQLKQEYKRVQIWLEDEKSKIDILIAKEEKKKETITKDERVQELNRMLKALDSELESCNRAKIFLQEYEQSQEDINSLLQLINSFENKTRRYEQFQNRVDEKIENFIYSIEEKEETKKELLRKDKLLRKGLNLFEHLDCNLSDVTPLGNSKYLYELIESFKSLTSHYTNSKVDLKSKLDRLNRLKNSHNDIDIYFNFQEYDNSQYVSQSINIMAKIDEIFEYKNKKLEMAKESTNQRFRNFVKGALPQNMSVFNDTEDKFLSQVAKINKNLSGVDFGVIKDIKLMPQVEDNKSIAKLLNELNGIVLHLSSLLNESSLFYEKTDVLRELSKLEMKFKDIKSVLKGSAISLQDTIDLSLSFKENEKVYSGVTQLKNESSTGGSMLLKIAIAIAILQLFTTEEKTPFFLIVDEVSRLHSDNQEKLRTFANSKGFGIVFVTPEPTYSKPEYIKYYRFRKNSDNEFEAIELNV